MTIAIAIVAAPRHEGGYPANPSPQEPEPHRQQEHLRQPVDERPVAGEQFVGHRDAEQRRRGPEAEQRERRRSFQRSAAPDRSDDGGIEEAARQEAEEQPHGQRVAGHPALQPAGHAGEEPAADAEPGDQVGQRHDRPDDQNTAGEDERGPLHADERARLLHHARRRRRPGRPERHRSRSARPCTTPAQQERHAALRRARRSGARRRARTASTSRRSARSPRGGRASGRRADRLWAGRTDRAWWLTAHDSGSRLVGFRPPALAGSRQAQSQSKPRAVTSDTPSTPAAPGP